MANLPRSQARVRHTSDSIRPRSAVLIVGSAVFFAVRTLFENAQLRYPALIDLLVEQVEGLQRPSSSHGSSWVMWTSASPQNQGQAKFLEYAENALRWEVRRFSPVDSYMVEPASTLGLSDSRSATRLVRFDAGIAFALGRLADWDHVVVVTDSFGLADPMMRVSRVGNRPVLAFFGRVLDTRWQRVLNKQDAAPVWIDLDDHVSSLFPDIVVTGHPVAGEQSDYIF